MRKRFGIATAGAVALLLSTFALAQQEHNYQELHNLRHAIIRGFTNETAMDQRGNADGTPTWDDPIKSRMGAWAPVGREYYLGARSGDVLRGDPNLPQRFEKVLEAIKVDRYGGGMFELFLQRPNTTDDTNMRRIYTATTSGVEFHVPIRGVMFGRTNQMVSDNGCFVTVQQGDGNFVTYDTTLGQVGDPNAAVWSAWSGKIGNRETNCNAR